MLRDYLLRPITALRRRQRYTHVISLGANCRPAHQIRRHFADERSYPFDRWVTPLDGLALYLDTLEADVYRAGDLIPIVQDGVTTGLINNRYFFQYFHEFPKDDTLQPPGAVRLDWEDSVDEATGRQRYLLRRFEAINCLGNRILFVRYEDWVSGKALAGRNLSSGEAFARMVTGLERRFGSARFDLLCINFSERMSPPMRGRIVHIDLADPNEDWRGSDELWSAAFARIAARPLRRPSAASEVRG